LFVLIVTVSLALDTTPPGVGVKEIATVLPLDMLITELMVALIIVFALEAAAEARIGDAANAITDNMPAMLTARFCFMVAMVFFLSQLLWVIFVFIV
jgi:hypothetical protein